MEQHKKQQLIDYLAPYITEHKRNLIQKILHNRTQYCTIVLEDVYQPHNASAILRSAECFGIQDVHIVQNRNRFTATEGIARGAAKWLSLYSYQTIETCVTQLKSDGYRIIATTPHGDAYALHDLPLQQKSALLFGTELKGLSAYALDLADEYVKIPMFGFTESFNVSVSVAICLYELVNRLHTSSINWQLSPEQSTNLTCQWYKKIIPAGQLLEEKFLLEQ